jgi:uncharacterized SAM-dependent methyltransferase
MKKIELVSREILERELAWNLSRGRLPDHFLYLGEAGVNGWLALADSPEFDIARRLEGLLRESLAELVPLLPKGCDVVSLGVGSGRKERTLLEAMVERGARPRYFPVDISSGMVDLAIAAVEHLGLEGTGLVAPLEAITGLYHHFGSPKLLCCLGNNFCNYDPDWLMGTLRGQLGEGDALLVDFHLVPENDAAAASEVLRRYGCELNRAFNLGPLVGRGLPAEACELSVGVVRRPGLGFQTRKAIRLKERATVQCGEEAVKLNEGATLQLGFTCKFTPAGLRSLPPRHGLEPLASFTTQDGAFALLLLRRVQDESPEEPARPVSKA